MRRTPSPALAVALAAVLAAAAADRAGAVVLQDVAFQFDPTPDAPGSGDEVSDVDAISDVAGPITQAVRAQLNGDGFQADGSVGPNGALGLEGFVFRPGELSARVRIVDDAIVNPFSTPQAAQANFVIDGGQFNLLAGPGSLIDFSLSLVLDGDPVFETGLQMTSQSFFAPPGVATSGEDIGYDPAAPGPSDTVAVPLSFQSVDLGVIQPGASVSLAYLLEARVRVEGPVEFASFRFSDPLSVGGDPALSAVTFTPAAVPVAPVPVPAGVWLLATALAGVAAAGRARSR